jgi:hypothetical protein
MSSFLVTHSPGVSGAPGRRSDSEQRRRQDFNNFQYDAHVQQEKTRRAMEEFYLIGKGRRGEKLNREKSQPLEHHWFSGGVIPDSHTVGKPSPPASAGGIRQLSIVHSLHHNDLPASPVAAASHQSAAVSVSPIDSGCEYDAPPPGLQDVASPRQRPASQAASSPFFTHQGGGEKFVPSPFTLRETHTPHTDQRHERRPVAVSRTSPIAEDYPTHEVDLDAVAVPHTKSGLPRGLLGIDFEAGRARDAQRIVARLHHEHTLAAKRDKQRQLRAALDAQIAEKSRRVQQMWEDDMTAVYGDGLRVGWDAEQRAATARQKHRNIAQTWMQQAAEHSERRRQEKEYYAPHPEDWAGMQRAMDESRQRDIAARSNPSAEWLAAWQQHQAVEGAIHKAAAVEQARQEMLTIGPSIANYSSRILQAERQRREDQAMYRRAVDQQVEDKRQRQQQLVAEELMQDMQRENNSSWPY